MAFSHLDWFVSRTDDRINSTKVIRAILEGNKGTIKYIYVLSLFASNLHLTILQDLIKRFPRHYISEFAQKILFKGQNPDYLDAFVGMTELSEGAIILMKRNTHYILVHVQLIVNDSRVSMVETEISSFLTSREWKSRILLWCNNCHPESEDYERRKIEMLASPPNSSSSPNPYHPDLSGYSDKSSDSNNLAFSESVFSTYNEVR